MPCVILYSVEVELPSNLPDELLDAIAGDLTSENCLDELRKRIKQWARTVSGEICHVAIDVE